MSWEPGECTYRSAIHHYSGKIPLHICTCKTVSRIRQRAVHSSWQGKSWGFLCYPDSCRDLRGAKWEELLCRLWGGPVACCGAPSLLVWILNTASCTGKAGGRNTLWPCFLAQGQRRGCSCPGQLPAPASSSCKGWNLLQLQVIESRDSSWKTWTMSITVTPPLITLMTWMS